MSGGDRPSRESLDAYIDGELSPDEMTRMAASLAKYEDLQAYVTQQKALRNYLDAAFAPLMAQPLPEALERSVRQTRLSPVSIISSAVSGWRNWLSEASAWRPALPVAAALALGLVVGIAINRSSDSQFSFVKNSSTGEVIAQGDLARALSDQLASDNSQHNAASIGVSFRSKSGRDCRTFSVGGRANTTGGIACRTGDSWVVMAMESNPHSQEPEAPYEMAGSTMPDLIRRAVNDMIAGVPFDAAAERAARKRDWRGSR